MEELYKIIVITVMVCLGLRTVSNDGMLLNPLREFALSNFPMIISFPIIVCVTCMASFWSIVVTLVWGYFHSYSILLFGKWIVAALFSSFLNTLFWNLLQLVLVKSKTLAQLELLNDKKLVAKN